MRAIQTLLDSKLDQNKVLTVSCITEFGERYCYYLLQSLLILYLSFHFKLNDAASSSLAGTVLGMTYISAIVGGIIADKILGYYRSAFTGTMIMIIGSTILSIADNIHWVYIGLCFISVSIGLIKSNISSFIGRFYDQSGLSDGYRDFGFNIFYVGINLGAFTAQLVASSLATKYSYHVAFSSSIIASVLMLINMIVGYFILRDYIANDIVVSFKQMLKAAAIIISYMVIVFIVLNYDTIADLVVFFSIAIATFILWEAAKVNPGYKRTWTAAMFFILSTIYWSLYLQLFISIEFFVNDTVQPTLFGLHLTTTQIISAESIFVLIFGYFMGRLWMYREQRGSEVHDIDKFNLAFILLAVMFALFYLAIKLSPNLVPASIMIGLFALLALSDLSLSAIGLSMVTKLAPPRFVSLFMSIWLITLGVGGKIAGFLSSSIQIYPNKVTASKLSMQHGVLMFLVIALCGVIICLLYRRQAIAQDEMHRILNTGR